MEKAYIKFIAIPIKLQTDLEGYKTQLVRLEAVGRPEDEDLAALYDQHHEGVTAKIAALEKEISENYGEQPMTKEEIKERKAEEEAWEAGAEERAREENKKKRADAFRLEADPLFFQEQRGEVPEGTYQAKIDEIRERFPNEEAPKKTGKK